MPLIKLTVSQLENLRSQVANIASKTEECSNSVANIRNGLDMEVAARRNIEEKLSQITTKLQKQSENANSYSNVLNDVINEFTFADNSKFSINSNIINGVISGVAGIGAAAVSATGAIALKKWKARQSQMHQSGLAAILSKKPPGCVLTAKSSLTAAQAIANGTFGKAVKKSWKDKLKDKAKKAVQKKWDKIKKAYGNVKKATKDCVSWVKKSYKEKGIVYTLAKYGKAAVKIAGGVAAVSAVVASGGALAPLVAAYGVNSIVGGVVDTMKITYNVGQGKTADIEETDLLRGVVVGAASGIGKELGNEKLGAAIGEGVYGAGKIVTSLYTIGTSVSKVTQANNINLSGVASESRTALKNGWDFMTKVEFHSLNPVHLAQEVKYQAALMKYTIPNTVEAAKGVVAALDLGTKFIGKPNDIVQNIIEGNTSMLPGKHSVFGGFYGTVNSTFNKIGDQLTK